MKSFVYIILPLLLLAGRPAAAQQVDSIYFHLYTDSLKKGVHNYINVDGKLSNGRWMPMTHKDIQFTATAGRWDGNSLILDSAFKGEKVDVKAVLKADPKIWREVTIYLKTVDTAERLPTVDEILKGGQGPARQPRRGRRG
ncbi:hypothetical protein [Paraflavitalea pollutisoli]|uniref:hypothetical protein n=1 Tax=Paraflavitalea pollutisoli TaxID=3034143 RepID=UPI0023EC29D4|nr:hypothetical protein [Paraflavitalea sp. H1-2-19X]